MKINAYSILLIATLQTVSIPLVLATNTVNNTLTMQVVNDALLLETVDENASPAAILRAQILLDRAHFSPGEIDARYGSNMRDAIYAYQLANNVESNGIVEVNTWALLNRDDIPVLSSYTITAIDTAGPFVNIPSSMLEKSKLQVLAYSSSTELLGEKFHVNPSLLKNMNTNKNFSQADTVIIIPNVLSPEPLPVAEKIIVDRSDASVSLIAASGKVIARFPASTGSKHDPLPYGNWLIQGIAKNPIFNYNPKLFWDAHPGSVKAKIAAGPNNPVGLVWIDLSKEHYGIHGTPEPSKIAKTESHGCIRLSNWDALALSIAATPGMQAILQE